MSETITSAFAQAFYVDTALTFTAKDPHDAVSGRTITIAVGWYWIWASNTVGGGTGAKTNPWCFLDALVDALNTGSGGGNYWSASVTQSSGKCTITCSNTGSLLWSSGGGQTVANILGFVPGTIAFATQTKTADYQPLFVVYAIARTNDNGWTLRPGPRAVASLPDGSVDAILSGYSTMVRSFDLRFHPTTDVFVSSENALATPYHPSSDGLSRALRPTSTPATTLTPPWTVVDFLSTAPGVMLACLFGNWQSFRGSDSEFYVCYLSGKSAAAELASKSTTPNWAARRDVNGLELSLTNVWFYE